MTKIKVSSSDSNDSGESFIYTCTILASCQKSFPTYEAWYQHERTAHPMEMNFWACLEGFGSPRSRCIATFDVEEAADFKTHVTTQHPEEFADTMKDGRPIESYLVGPNGGWHRYWCGFCGRSYSCVDYAVDEWWEERMMHIKAHFERRGSWNEVTSIEEWAFIQKP